MSRHAVVRTLALGEGLALRLPLHDPEMGGFRYAPLAVAHDSTAGVWRVVVHDTRVTATYRVDARSHRLLTLDVERLPRSVAS